jgi:hypothetical protein
VIDAVEAKNGQPLAVCRKDVPLGKRIELAKNTFHPSMPASMELTDVGSRIVDHCNAFR